MLPVILQVRYGREASSMDRLVEIGMAIFLLVTVPRFGLWLGLATVVLVMWLFSYWVGKTSWSVFSMPPLSVPPKKLVWDLACASCLSIPMAAGIVAAVLAQHLLLIIAMIATCLVTAIMVVLVGEASKSRQTHAGTMDVRLSEVEGPYQFFALDWRRRRLRPYRRIVIPFVLLPLMGVGTVVSVVLSSGSAVTVSTIATGFALGCSFNLMYFRTDDLPGNYLREITGLPEWFVQLPLMLVVGFCAVFAYILDPDAALFVAVMSAAVVAGVLGVMRIIIGEHTAPVGVPDVVPRSTLFQEIFGFFFVLSVFACVLILGRLL